MLNPWAALSGGEKAVLDAVMWSTGLPREAVAQRAELSRTRANAAVASLMDQGLLEQAEREVFSAQLEVRRLRETLDDCAQRVIVLRRPKSFTPLSFPLWAEAVRGRLSTEDWRTRVQRAASQLERRHGG